VSFKFFSKLTSPSHPAPVGIAVGLPPKRLTQGPLDAPESKTPTTELDTLSVFPPEDLSVFPPEDSASADRGTLTTESRQAASRYVQAVDARDTGAASQTDMKRGDDFRRLLGQTPIVLERLKGDTNALRVDLSELRSFGARLGQGYTRLGEICRLTEQRSELTVEALNAIEKRIEPLEVVRDLSAATEDKLASLNQLVEVVRQCGASFEAQKEAIEQGREEATRVARLMEELQARVLSLTEKREWLGQAEETIGRLEHRATETTSRLERRVNDFETQKQTIEQALAEAIRVTTILSGLEGRVTALTGGDQGLARAEDTIGQLEQRAATTMAELERRVSDFDVQKQTIGQALASALTEGDQRLDQAAETVRRLEQRAAATLAQLERRANDFDAQKGAVERASVEAMRLTAILSALEGRVAALTGSNHTLEHAETTIAQLERRTNEARVRLEQVVRAESDVKHKLERVGKQLASRSPAWTVRRPLLRWATSLGALGAVGLLGIVVLRTRDQWTVPVSLLPSKASPLATFVMPAGRTAATSETIAANEVSAAARRDPARATRTARTADASRLGGSAEATARYVGTLEVESEPTRGAVFVDRQQVGETPLQLTLRAASHVVRIERDGYDRWTTAVLVAADKHTRVSAKLQAVRDPRQPAR
jgi:chromosome segregation ATPase